MNKLIEKVISGEWVLFTFKPYEHDSDKIEVRVEKYINGERAFTRVWIKHKLFNESMYEDYLIKHIESEFTKLTADKTK